MSGISLANRLALRDLVRHKGRSLLIVLLLAIPIAGLSVFASSISSYDDKAALSARFGGSPALLVPLTNADGRCEQQDLGNAYCAESDEPMGDPTALTAASVPGGLGRVTSKRTAPLQWRKTTQEAPILVTDVAAARSAGQLVVKGSEQPGAGEVIVVARAGQVLGLNLGDKVWLGGSEQTIVGVARLRSIAEDLWFVVGPSNPLAQGAVPIQVELSQVPDAATVRQLNHQGLAVLSLAHALKYVEQYNQDNLGQEATTFAIMVGLAVVVLLVTGTVASSAFAIGFQQQRRTLALLSATGAPPRMLGAIVRRQGLLLGLVGAALSLVLSVAASLALQTWSRDRGLEYPPPYHVPWLTVAALCLTVVIAAVVAAWIPARQVAKADVMTAVRSAETASTPARKPWLGLGLALLGMTVGLLGALRTAQFQGSRQVEKGVIPAVASVVLLFFAALFSMGWILQTLGGLSARGPLAVRLAARDWTRNRQRAAAGVAATMAMMTLVSTALITLDSVGRTALDDWRPSHPEKLVSVVAYGQVGAGDVSRVAGRVVEELGAPLAKVEVPTPVSAAEEPSGLVSIRLLDCEDDLSRNCGGTSGEPVLGDGDLISFFSGAPAPEAATQVLAQGGVVVFGKGIRNGRVDVIVGEKTLSVPAVQVGDSLAPPVISQALLDKFGIKNVDFTTGIWMRYPHRPTAEQQAKLQAITLETLRQPLGVGYDTGPDQSYHKAVTYAAVVLGSLLVVISIITTSLALRDARRTMEVMGGIGASTWTLRAMTAVSATATTALGVVLGLLVGMLPLVVVILATRGYVLLAIPWLYLAAMVIGVPLILGLVGWLLPVAKIRTIRAD